MEGKFFSATKLTNSQLKEISAIEKEIFAEAGFTQFILPVFATWGKLYLYEKGSSIAAGAEIIRAFDHPEEAYMAGFWVSKNFQGAGIGKLFLAEIINETRKSGIKKLVLTVSPENKQAVSFYKKHGYKKERFATGFYGPGQDRYLMALSL